MRIVGNTHWNEFANDPAEALARGARLDVMMALPGLPDYWPRGVFRGNQAYFAAMDAERERLRQEWFDEHAKRPA